MDQVKILAVYFQELSSDPKLVIYLDYNVSCYCYLSVYDATWYNNQTTDLKIVFKDQVMCQDEMLKVSVPTFTNDTAALFANLRKCHSFLLAPTLLLSIFVVFIHIPVV